MAYGEKVYLSNAANNVGFLDLASMPYAIKDNGPSPEARQGKFGGLVFSHIPTFASSTKDRTNNSSSQWIVRKGYDESGMANLLKVAGAQSGSVQVSLLWSNKNDLDLQVVDPSGDTIKHDNRKSKSGGSLDIDMNTSHDQATNNAVENIFWPEGKAPKGRYKIVVDHFKNHGQPGCEDPTRFTVRLVVGGVTKLFPGEVVFNDPKRKQVTVAEFDVNENANLVGVAKTTGGEPKGEKVNFNDTVWFESASAPGYFLDTNMTVGSYSSLSGITGSDPRLQLLIFGTKGDTKSGSQLWTIEKAPNVVDNKAEDVKIAKLLTAKGAKTGTVQISLAWNNKNDLDLQVIDPLGETIKHDNKKSKSGGTLDLDMNISHDQATNDAVENIYWPEGRAPKGRYKIIVDHYKNHLQTGCEDPTRFTVRVLVNGVSRLIPGEVVFADPRRKQATFEFDVP